MSQASPIFRNKNVNLNRQTSIIEELKQDEIKITMATTAEYPMSPPRSPSRLPSPPPPVEDFTGPQSPALTTPEDVTQEAPSAQHKDAASRRIRPGTKAADMADGPPLVELSEVQDHPPHYTHVQPLTPHPRSTPPFNSPNTSKLSTITTPIPPPLQSALSANIKPSSSQHHLQVSTVLYGSTNSAAF